MTGRWAALLFALLPAVLAGTGPALAAANEPDLVAINVLLEPDARMRDVALAANERLRGNYPDGFALDAGHVPHVTLLQRYVRRADLEKVIAAVTTVAGTAQPTALELTAIGYYYVPYESLGLAGIRAARTPGLLRLQERLIAAVAPFAVARGTGAAFVPRADGRPISQWIVDYVNAYVPTSSGGNFNPHVTVGLGEVSFVKRMVAEPFDAFSFRAGAVSIYQLGEYGNAQRLLWTSTAADDKRGF